MWSSHQILRAESIIIPVKIFKDSQEIDFYQKNKTGHLGICGEESIINKLMGFNVFLFQDKDQALLWS